ncbi:MAG: hypothetical protein H6733_00110, partial [Alphaproteobacteria bacterium]|nr:hypothetical protein [Alphaproteobacteria bacterium]
MTRRHLRAYVVLTADLVRRFLREGIVLRSLVFPVTLAVAALVGTVGVVLWLQPPLTLAVTADLATPELVAAVEADGWPVVVVDDPGQLVRDGDAALGSDGHAIWVGNGGQPPLSMESHLRKALGTSWRPDQPRAVRARAIRESDAPGRLAIFIGALFAMYGVVFGAGSVARDRDEGTLDAELSMPVPHVVHGFARWTAGTVVLGGFFSFSVYLLHAIMGIPEAPDLALKGTAAAAGATALGLIVVG